VKEGFAGDVQDQESFLSSSSHESMLLLVLRSWPSLVVKAVKSCSPRRGRRRLSWLRHPAGPATATRTGRGGADDLPGEEVVTIALARAGEARVKFFGGLVHPVDPRLGRQVGVQAFQDGPRLPLRRGLDVGREGPGVDARVGSGAADRAAPLVADRLQGRIDQALDRGPRAWACQPWSPVPAKAMSSLRRVISFFPKSCRRGGTGDGGAGLAGSYSFLSRSSVMILRRLEL